ncbi:alpha/beta hydrolase [Tessaracoccus caeni]|uniref:alpha/beta hydrolase n=1 Tax=Tessaracoccus caeni TaxID=3031239 RepID=UPI0023DB0EA0|nr:alpha/beta fold hydrolase [Tessaracoccus caeni]MDF1487871.1 alpha/beta fold hydrolase [Tessaracoccus caeni]
MAFASWSLPGLVLAAVLVLAMVLFPLVLAAWSRGRVPTAVIVGASAAFAVVALLGSAWAVQRSLIYYPDTTDPGSASTRFASGQDVELHTGDGMTLNAWRVDPASPNGMAVLYLPGNGGNRLVRSEVGQQLADRGFTVLLVDYRGYGGNPGSPSEDGLIRDAEAAATYLVDAGFAPERTVYVGESIGTGVAVALAAERPPAGVVLRSPYTRLSDVATEQVGLPIGWLLSDRFDTMGRIGDVDSPLLVLAGVEDQLIPPTQSEEVAAGAPNLHEIVILPGAGHNDDAWFGSYLADQVAAFAEHLG